MLLNAIIENLNNTITRYFPEDLTYQVAGLTVPITTGDAELLNVLELSREAFEVNDLLNLNSFHRATHADYRQKEGKGAGHSYAKEVSLALVCLTDRPRMVDYLEYQISTVPHVKLKNINLNAALVHKEYFRQGEFDFRKELFAIHYTAYAALNSCVVL